MIESAGLPWDQSTGPGQLISMNNSNEQSVAAGNGFGGLSGGGLI
jgi:hypothetical protein